MSFINFLASQNIISEGQVPVVKEKIKNGETTLEGFLLDMGMDKQEILGKKGEYFGVPFRNLADLDVPFEILKYVPEESAVHYKIVPIGVKDGFLEIGIVNPDNIEARDALNFISSKENLPFKLYLISEEDFGRILDVYKGLSGQVTKALTELETDFTEEEKEIRKQIQENKKGEEIKLFEDAPVTKIVATILLYAVEGGASDIHIEPMSDKVRVRFRVDGILNTSLTLPLKVLDAVVARVKILSKMRLDEKRKPQDNRFTAKIDNRKIDFRVSTFPTNNGEKVVMRILDQFKGIKSLEELGLSKKNYDMIMDSISRPFGMILISGPTGSGKSTTLYSFLKKLDTETKNVLSLEDPIEYSINGVSQSQIRADIDYTFANGLRTTLRQDPDIIMVGEIRDGETAKLAIQAALTGHLVFSTVHTNTASGIVPRLIDMGVDPYLIPPTLILGIAQRLVRKICPNSGELVKVDGSFKSMIELSFKDLPEEFKKDLPLNEIEYLKIKPNAECPNGTRGREAVFEMFMMNREMEKVILENPIESAIYDVARKYGLITMKEDAIIKCLRKTISFEEINTL